MAWQLARIFIDVITPVLILVMVGYTVGPRLHLEARTLARLAYFILIPAFVFNIVSTAEIPLGLASQMVLFIMVVYAGCALLGLVIGWLLGRPLEMIAAYVLIGVFGNVGNFGLPIIEFRLGSEALLAASVYFLASSVISFIVGVAAASWPRGGGLGATLAVFKTPALIAILPGLLFNLVDLESPLFLSRSVTLLAQAMIPTMLVTLGIQLAAIERPQVSRDVVIASAVRLVGGPVLALLLVIPFGLSGLERGAGVFQASMPAAVTASVIAIEYELLPTFVTTTVLFSTLASVVTLTTVLALV